MPRVSDIDKQNSACVPPHPSNGCQWLVVLTWPWKTFDCDSLVCGGREGYCRINAINIFCDFYSVDFIGKCAYRTCSSSHFMLLKIIFVNIEFINLIHYFVTNMSPKGAYHAFGAFCSCKDLWRYFKDKISKYQPYVHVWHWF